MRASRATKARASGSPSLTFLIPMLASLTETNIVWETLVSTLHKFTKSRMFLSMDEHQRAAVISIFTERRWPNQASDLDTIARWKIKTDWLRGMMTIVSVAEERQFQAGLPMLVGAAR